MLKNFLYFILAVLSLNTAHSQVIDEFVDDFSFSASSTRILVSDSAKYERSSKRGGGKIVLEIDDETTVSTEWLTSLKIAADVWSEYLSYGDTLKLNVIFSEDIQHDMSISMTYNLLSQDGQSICYPAALLRNITDEPYTQQFDGIITINSSQNWIIGIGNECTHNAKNLTLAFMQCIARCLGFGSSAKMNIRNQVELQNKRYPTIFDTYIENENNIKLISYINKRDSLKAFSQGSLGKVYFKSDEQQIELYAPTEFDNNYSLRYTTDTTSIMCYHTNGNRNLIIDNSTLGILSTLGWGISTSTYNIVSNDVDSTGVTSAYATHEFYISPNTINFTSYNWKLLLPLQNGNPVAVYTSSNSTFLVPALSNEEIYEHTIEGDIRGSIVFEGILNGDTITASYPITFELKPHILSVQLVSKQFHEENPYYYDAVIEIRYEGSHYVHAYVEEEYNPYLTSYYSSTPFFTRLNLKNVESWGGAWLDITIRNNYGSDNFILDLCSENESSIRTRKEYVLQINTIENGTDGCAWGDLYSLDGTYIGKYNEIEKDLQGVYILKQEEKNTNRVLVKKLKIK